LFETADRSLFLLNGPKAYDPQTGYPDRIFWMKNIYNRNSLENQSDYNFSGKPVSLFGACALTCFGMVGKSEKYC
jgi:hypothetical protein